MPVKHLAIIPDGNRRWARQRGLTPWEGHRRGYENVKTIGGACLDRGIAHLTLYAFSTENWRREAREVEFLLALLVRALRDEVAFFAERGVRLRVVGRREGLPAHVREAVEEAETRTEGGTRGQLNLCVNYGGRAEIVEAVRRIVSEQRRPEEIDEDMVSSSLWMAGIPDPDLIIRTSGEQRLSGFLPWESVYSELLFVDRLWPDFSVEDLDAALAEFDLRQRRYGL